MFDVLKKLGFFFRENKWRYILSFITLALANIGSVVVPYLVGRFIDAIVTGEMNSTLLSTYAIQFLILILLTYALDYVWGYGLFSGAYKLQKEMRQKLMRHFLRMRAPYFEKFRTGDTGHSFCCGNNRLRNDGADECDRLFFNNYSHDGNHSKLAINIGYNHSDDSFNVHC